MLTVSFSAFAAPATTSVRPTRHSMPWPDLQQRLTTHQRTERRDTGGWSPATYPDGATRGSASVEALWCAVCDFDHGTLDDVATIRDHLTRLGLTYALHSTYRSTPDAPRFRVIVPFSRPVEPMDWPRLWPAINQRCFLGQSDPQTKDAGRFFYVPSAPPDGIVFAASGDGDPLDVDSLDLLSAETAGAGDDANGSDHAPLDYDAIMRGVGEGQRDMTLYRMACDMRGRDVPIEYALLMIAEAARRCVPPFDSAEAESKVHAAYRQFTPNIRLVANVSRRADQVQAVTVPPFPLETLPDVFQRYVEHVARLKVCPPEYVAIPMLVGAGTALGNVVRLRLNASWQEGPQLFAALIGDPGSKKTPATQAGLRPLTRLQSRLNKRFKERMQAYEEQVADWEALPKKERATIAKPTPPEYRHVTVNDVTIEKLADVLASGKGVTLAHDELAGWVSGMDQYRGGRGSDRQHYLSMWSGTSFKVDRKSHPIPVLVENPCLGVIGGIQPDMLGSLADERNRSDGFLDRILWAYPDPIPDCWVDDDGTDSGLDALVDYWQQLYDVRALETLTGEPEPRVMELAPSALEVWRWWYDEHAQDRNGGQLHPLLLGPWAKMGTQLARLALILHCLDGDGSQVVAAETVGRAINLVEYFKAHARRVFAALEASRAAAGAAKSADYGDRVLRVLREQGEMSQTDVRRRAFGDNIPADRLRSVLGDLEDAGTVVRREEKQAGRRSVTWWTALPERPDQNT